MTTTTTTHQEPTMTTRHLLDCTIEKGWGASRQARLDLGTGRSSFAAGRTVDEAVTALRDHVMLRLRQSVQHAVVFCGSGVVLACDAAGYTILDDEAGVRGSVVCGDDDFPEVIAKAERHAEQSYGGVVRTIRY